MSENIEYSKKQPKDGDRVVHCGHLDAEELHFIFMHGFKFRRANGSIESADWLVCCTPCFRAGNGNPTHIQIRGGGIWKGDDPIVEKADPPRK